MIAQTAMLFLCEHIGKKFGDNYTTTRGNVISIKQACFRFTDRYLDKQFTRHLAHTIAINDSVVSPHIFLSKMNPTTIIPQLTRSLKG